MKHWLAKSIDGSNHFSVTIDHGTVRRERLEPKDRDNKGETYSESNRSLTKPTDEVFICDGLTDLQVNGYNSVDMSDPQLKADSIEEFCKTLARLGVTRFLPTLTTQSLEHLSDALANLSKLEEESELFRQMTLGVHLEGPFISPDDGPRGAHPLIHCRPPNVEVFHRLQESSNGRIVIVTMSPEYEEAPEFVKSVSKSTIVSIGHTAAKPEQIRAAVDHGATMSTHLGNGMHKELVRHPNYLWEQLADDRLVAGLIGDGVHLDSSTLKSFVRAKGVDRCFLVSDSTLLSGQAPGIYRNSALGDVEVTEDRRLVIAGQRAFNAGAYRPMKDAMRFLLRHGIADAEEAIRMMSLNPINFLGKLIARKNRESTFMLFTLDEESQMRILLTVINGVTVYSGESV